MICPLFADMHLNINFSLPVHQHVTTKRLQFEEYNLLGRFCPCLLYLFSDPEDEMSRQFQNIGFYQTTQSITSQKTVVCSHYHKKLKFNLTRKGDFHGYLCATPTITC